MSMLQPCLMTGGRSADADALVGLRRMELGAGAWIEHLEGWLTDDLEVFDTLCRVAPWRQGDRVMYDRRVVVPRLTAWCADPARLPHPTLVRAFEALNAHYGPEPFTSAGLCWYRDGRDSVAWHGDTIRHHRRETVIAIVSVGAARPLALRPRGGGRVCPSHSATATCSSWVALARPPGSTPYPKSPRRARASAFSSGRPGSIERSDAAMCNGRRRGGNSRL